MATTTELYVRAHAAAGSHRIGSDDQSVPCLKLGIKFNVVQTYYTSDGTFYSTTPYKIRRDPIGQISSQYPYHSLTHDLLSRMIDRMKIPFPLEKMQWKGTRNRKTPVELENLEELISRVLEDARSMVNRCSNPGQNVLTLYLDIENRVILPRHEIEAMDRAKAKEERVLSLHQFVSSLVRDPCYNFNSIQRQIRYRVMDTAPAEKAVLGDKYERFLELELLELAARDYFGGHRSVPATTSSIQALATFTFEDGDKKEEEEVECAICKNDILSGSPVTCLPCSHTYHQLCIRKWLETSHMCPLCRFKLPTT